MSRSGSRCSAARSRQEFLPRCAAGAISAFLLTEPDVGSDPRLGSTATLSADRTEYVVDGVKLWTTAVAKKLAFVAATAFALESVFELSAALADSGQKDVRIEAALAKLWFSEMAYRVAGELVQLRGSRGYETADSLAARGERAVAAEQLLRDLRISRVFEGSSEIMKLLIAARRTFYAMSRWQSGLDQNQALPGRIVDIGTELFAMSAGCTRAAGARSGRG